MKINIWHLATVIILTILLVMTLIGFLIREYQRDVKDLNQMEAINIHYEKDLENYIEFTNNYNELKNKYDNLYSDYLIIKNENKFNWDIYEVTGYTSLDEGVGNIAYTGIDISLLNNFVNIVAVDKNIIPLGSILLIRYQDKLIPALALDIGGAIKGNRIDLYFGYDKDKAFEFGRQKLEVGILK